MSLIYRKAEEEDLEALRDLGLAAYGRLKVYLSPANWEKMKQVILSEDNFPPLINQSYGVVCQENQSLLGMAFLVPSGNPTKIYTKDTCYIRMVGVHPDAGDQGIAQTLTHLCIEKAKESGERKISLHSAEVMFAARHIYEKLGFQKIRLLDEHYGLPYWLYEYELI